MPKYTDEQIERAKNTDVAAFLTQTEGYSFKRSGKYLKCKNPDKTNQPSSLTVDTTLNRIFYNSVTGNKPLSAIDWCVLVKNMDFQSSLKYILEEEPQGARAERQKYERHIPQPKQEESRKFQMPEKSEAFVNVKAYLTKTRGIPDYIIDDCIKRNIIYQDTRKNAVFVGMNDSGQPKYAARRGTFTPDSGEPFKRDAAGSDKNFAFKLVGKNSDTIYVAEAAIDVLSLAALEDKFNGNMAHKNKTYISTGGAGIDNAVEQFCKTHNVKTINICFDNDEAGKNGMEKIMRKYRAMGYEVNDMRAAYAHDYNDELTAFNNNPDFYPTPPKPVIIAENLINERNDIMPEMDISVKEQIEESEEERAFREDWENRPITNEDIPPEQPDYFDYPPINEADIPPENPDYYFPTFPKENAVPEKLQPSINHAGSNNEVKGTVSRPAQESQEENKNPPQTEKESDIKSQEKSEQEKQADTTPEKDFEELSAERKMLFLLGSMKKDYEKTRAYILDRIDGIDEKIAKREERIEKLEAKAKDIETSLKTSAAMKRAFGGTPIGGLIDKNIAKKQAKITKIREEKIPKHKNKIERQIGKKEKAAVNLGKVNRKIETIDKVQDFLNSFRIKNKEERNREFVSGLENLSDIRRENLENKAMKYSKKINALKEQYNSPNNTHRDKLEIAKKLNGLRGKMGRTKNKIKELNELHRDLQNIKDGKFTEAEIDITINKTADRISERLESTEITDNKKIVDNIIDVSAKAGSEAIKEAAKQKAKEQTLEHERIPADRQPETTISEENKILNSVAAITGINISELNRLPAEIKSDVISEFKENNGNIPTEKLAERLCEAVGIEKPESVKPPEQNINQSLNGKEKDNPFKQSKEPLFSRTRMMSDDFKPTSDKSREDIQKTQTQNHSMEI